MKVAIGIPGYGAGNLMAAPLRNLDGNHHVHYREFDTSFLTMNFNELWCWALTLRDAGTITHFLMVHSDIAPVASDWFEIMIAEMEKANAQVLSAISPIKNWYGLTSTAFDNNEWTPTRLTIEQMNKLPPTWTCDNLLFNTGLMMVDMRDPWVEKVCFQVRNWLGKLDGKWAHRAEPEDWHFSRQCKRLGVRAYVTRAVQLNHAGSAIYSTRLTWGGETDTINKSTDVVEVRNVNGSIHPLHLGGHAPDVRDAGVRVVDLAASNGKESAAAD